jgi:predicted nucleic acid-binding protein
MRYLLDTNIISNITKPAPSESLMAWMAEQADQDLFIASLTIAEIRRGILEKPSGKRRDQLEVWFSGPKAHKRCLPDVSYPSTKEPRSSGPG